MEIIKGSFVVSRDNIVKRSHSLVFLWLFVLSIFFIISFFLFELIMMNKFSKYYEKTQILAEKSIIENELKDIKNIERQRIVDIDKEIEKTLKKRIDMGYKIVKNIYNKFTISNKSRIEIEESYIEALRSIRFDEGRNYFTLFTMQGRNILNPNKLEYEGRNLIKLKDDKDQYVVQRMIDIVRNKQEGKYYWYYKLNNKKMDKRVVYVKKIKPLNLFITTSVFYSTYLNQKREVSINKNIRYLLPEKSAVVNYMRALNLGKDFELIKKKNKFLKDLKKNGLAFMDYSIITKLSQKELKDKFGWLRSVINLIPPNIYTPDAIRQYVLYAKIDKDIGKIILVKKPINKLQDQADSVQSYYLHLILNKLLYLIIVYFLIAFWVTRIMMIKISKEIKKILKELATEKAKATYNQKKLDDFIEHYPYPLLIVDDKAKKFQLNKAFKTGGEFQPQFFQQNDANMYPNYTNGVPLVNQTFVDKKIENTKEEESKNEKTK